MRNELWCQGGLGLTREMPKLPPGSGENAQQAIIAELRRLPRHVVPRLAFAALLCAAGILTSDTGIAQRGADTPFVFSVGDEWSLDARSLRDAYRRWQTRRIAAERLAAFPDSANTVGWLAQAGRLGDAFDVLERVVTRQPTRIADALQSLNERMFEIQTDRSHGFLTRLEGLMATARRALPTLDREDAATLDIALLSFETWLLPERNELETRRHAVLVKHEGTTASRLAAIDYTDSAVRLSDWIVSLDAIADREPGTIVAAKARYMKAFHLSRNDSTLVRQGGDPDPTERLLTMLAIVQDLESGRYPPCRWVEDAPDLAVGFFVYRPKIAPANAARLLDGLRRFATEHQPLLAAGDDDALPYLVTKKLPAIAAFLPDGPAAMERVFAEFAREWRDKAAAPYLKARWLDLQQDDGSAPLALAPRSATHEADVRALLASAAAIGGESLYARRALARLAEREFSDGASLESAQAHFSEYLQRFGAADDAWLIGLRLGQVEQARGRHRDAVRRFADVTTANAAAPIVRALAAAYAARASEDAGDFASALPYYRAAAAAWTPDIDDTLALDLPQPLDTPPADISDILLATNPVEVSRGDVDRRIRELARALPAEGGLELERGRWLLRRERPREALPVLERVASRYPRSPAGADARDVVSRARLDAALALADASKSSSDPQTALRELDALSRGAFDANRGMAGILAATLTLLQGRSVDADAQLTGSLQRWAREASRMRTPAPGSLEHDVLAIRDALFLPLGGKSLMGNWNGFAWPSTLPPFVVAASALRVRVAGSDEWASVDVSRQPPNFTNAVFISPDDMAYLTRAVSRVGGTQRREPTAIMQVPNQPIGDAQTVIRWWNRFFPARPGHWVGFEIATYPAFFSIQFTNAERSRAVVPVTIGYAGADVILEKVNGMWTIKELVNQWVT